MAQPTVPIPQFRISGVEETSSFSFADQFESSVIDSLANHQEELGRISASIWNNPELGYREYHAVKVLTEYLEELGYKVIQNFCDIETSFLGEYQTSKYDSNQDETIAVLCEYDALPDLGHACGHNLIAVGGLATFIAVCEALKKNPQINGRVLCMGSPAEESGGGKVVLVESGAFRGVNFAMMSHPAPIDLLEPDILGIDHYKAEFYGRSAHASCGPWEGVNALDAAISAYSGVSLLRQQLQPGHQVHMIIGNGGTKPNIIPEYSRLEVYIRAPTAADVTVLRTRVLACLEGAADATGCRLECGINSVGYSALMSNKTMLSIYELYGKKHGMHFPKVRPGYGSTDMGNVSTVVPSIHPIFGIGGMNMPMIHTKEFTEVAGRSETTKFALRSALAMALTALELFSNGDFRSKVREEFHGSRTTFVGADLSEDDAIRQKFQGMNARRRSSRALLVEQGLLKPSLDFPEDLPY